jgi:TRAP transporter TAXI family solute receptor
MVDLPPPGVDPKQDEVISEELDRAVKAISVRLERRKHKYIFAGGPSGGEYSRIIDAITTHIAKSRPDLKIGSLNTQGSVENAWLLNLGQADFALIQSNIAAMAVSGEGPFAGGEPITKLRAMGSLFPEPVHVVVSVQSVIRSISDLRGKVVDVGMLKSGTYYDASTVLRSHGLAIKDLKEARTKGHEDAIKRLRAGSLDAFFVTMGSPAKDLQQLATRARIRLISLDNRAIERIVSESPGMIRFVLPPNTYPGQTDEVNTVAATSLFVTTIDTPQEEAFGLLKLVFEKTEAMVSYSSQASKISKENGLRGITVPMHAAATRYFAGEKKGSANLNNKPK